MPAKWRSRGANPGRGYRAARSAPPDPRRVHRCRNAGLDGGADRRHTRQMG